MTDYSNLSDFEINSAVHNALMKDPYKIEFLGNDRIRWVRGSTDVTTEKVAYSKKSLKDYCNSPADAFPIIEANRISLRNRYEGDWKAENEWGESHFHVACNPLRAAMVVFLMMQDARNEK
ncbi:phage protein NinX family protein [Klebsiella quasipneumoniae]|uniref:phage protein NinX family protein n=1 Tax=Klebsiella quasipneumoniae TaxID=1463165 RepID=UPI0037BF27FB